MTFDTTTLLLIVGLTASIVHIAHLTFPANKTVTKIDDLGQSIIDEMHRLFPQVAIPSSRPTISELESILKNNSKVEILPNGEVRTQQVLPPGQAPIMPPGSVATLTTKVAPLIILIAIGLSLGCGASARQKILTAAVATMTTSETALTTYNHKHEIDIASDQSTTPEQRHEKLVAYRATRDKVELAIDLAWRALGIAGPLNDDTSLVNVKLAVSQVITVVEALIHGNMP